MTTRSPQPNAPNATQLRKFASDPFLFVSSLPFGNGKTFGEMMVPHHREWLDALCPAVLALAKGEKPEAGRVWMEATKGAAKDTVLAALMLWLLAFSRRPLTCQVGAADQDQADEQTKAARLWLRYSPWLADRVTINNFRIVCKATESTCEIIPADIAGSHGGRPDFLIVNEIHAITKWEFVQNLLDNASKMPNGLVVVATNAGHIGTEAWKLREIARTSPRWKHLVYDRPAPWLDPAELDEARRRNSSERYARLFRGVWSRGLGDALDMNDVEAAIDRTLGPMAGPFWVVPYTTDRVYPQLAAGLDLGIKHDHSALVSLAADGARNRIRLADCQSWAPSKVTGKVDLEEVEAGVLEAKERLGLVAVYYDPYQAELMAARLRKKGVNMIEQPFTGSSLNMMATTLLETFRSRRIDLYDCPRLVNDLMRLTIVEKSYGHKLESVRDADGHADTATAFAIALPHIIDMLRSSGQSWGGMIDSGGLSVASSFSGFGSRIPEAPLFPLPFRY